MDYFNAVQQGRSRVQRAVQLLDEVGVPSSPVLFIKVGKTDWTPVGDENFYSIIEGKDFTAAVVLCDGDGNSKAMSAWLGREAVSKFAPILESRGVGRYAGEVKLPI